MEMLIFLDTEFTDFINTEVLSIGMVTADDKFSFYAERTDYELRMCSKFVKQEILPLFDRRGFIGTKKEIAFKLSDWLIDLPYKEVVVVIDYHADWQIFGDLLAETKRVLPMKLKRSPEYLQTMTDFATNVSVQGIEEYFNRFGAKRHHALDDAKANRYGWLQAMKTLF